jgi:hypothetical protein
MFDEINRVVKLIELGKARLRPEYKFDDIQKQRAKLRRIKIPRFDTEQKRVDEKDILLRCDLEQHVSQRLLFMLDSEVSERIQLAVLSGAKVDRKNKS